MKLEMEELNSEVSNVEQQVNVPLNQNQSHYSDQSQQTRVAQWANQNSKQFLAADPKRGKMSTRESRFILVLLLIG